MSKRRRAREMALQMLYQSDLGEAPAAEVFSGFLPGEYEGGGKSRGETSQAFAYAKALVAGVDAHLEEIDGLIVAQADNWRLNRMPAVDRNILRLAVYEFLYQTDVPKLVVLDQAIELAKKFGSEQSGRFVNGLLDGLLKSQAFPGSMT